ncbi:MAG: hypothetical protein ACHQAY_07940 [Hyphomicrobiales bacterium]
MPRDHGEWFQIAAGVAACLIAAGLYRWFGFFGVGLFGMFILFVATRVDLQDGRGVGSDMNAGLFAQQIMAEQRFTRSEQAEWKSELRKSRRAIRYAQMVGLAFLVVGGAGFLFFDLHLGG